MKNVRDIQLSKDEFMSWLSYVEHHKPKFKSEVTLVLTLLRSFGTELELAYDAIYLIKNKQYDKVIQKMFNKNMNVFKED